MKKINCIFYDDKVDELQERISTVWRREFEQNYQKDYQDLSYDDFSFEFYNSAAGKHRSDRLVGKWKEDGVDFVIVDARAVGDSDSTVQATQLLACLKSQNLNHCVFTSSGNKLMYNELSVFEGSNIFKKTHEKLTDEQIKTYSFSGNFYDMLAYIKNSPYEFYKILHFISENSNKHTEDDFKTSFYAIDEIFQVIKKLNCQEITKDNFKGFQQHVRILYECLLRGMIDNNIIPVGISINQFDGSLNVNNSIKFLLNPENRTVYSYFNSKEKEIIFVNNFIELNASFNAKKNSFTVNRINDNSKYVLKETDIGENIVKTGIGELFHFIKGYGNKSLHTCGFNSTLDYHLSVLFAIRTLLKRLIKLLQANKNFKLAKQE